jgi:hypothetical protein
MVPFARRTERPRHFSVNNITPSGVKAMSHGSLRPDNKTVLVNVGSFDDKLAPVEISCSAQQLPTFKITQTTRAAINKIISLCFIYNPPGPSLQETVDEPLYNTSCNYYYSSNSLLPAIVFFNMNFRIVKFKG